jgi:hypothetical protein
MQRTAGGTDNIFGYFVAFMEHIIRSVAIGTAIIINGHTHILSSLTINSQM